MYRSARCRHLPGAKIQLPRRRARPPAVQMRVLGGKRHVLGGKLVLRDGKRHPLGGKVLLRDGKRHVLGGKVLLPDRMMSDSSARHERPARESGR